MSLLAHHPVTIVCTAQVALPKGQCLLAKNLGWSKARIALRSAGVRIASIRTGGQQPFSICTLEARETTGGMAIGRKGTEDPSRRPSIPLQGTGDNSNRIMKSTPKMTGLVSD